MPTDLDLEMFERELKALGENEIRRRLGLAHWGDSPRNWRWVQAREHLARLDRERDAGDRREALRQGDELVNEARQANLIAKQANRHANVANLIAVGAFLVSVIAFLVAIGVL